MNSAKTIIVAAAGSLALAACGGGSGNATDNAVGTQANDVAEDPFGATGAPGSDMTDNGATDGSAGLADGNATPGDNAVAGGNGAQAGNTQ